MERGEGRLLGRSKRTEWIEVEEGEGEVREREYYY